MSPRESAGNAAEYPTEQIRRAYSTAFIEGCGVVLTRCGDGECELVLNVEERHRQHMGFVHGGVVAALIDHAGGTAALTTMGEGRMALTSDLNVSYLRPALPPKLRFCAKVLKAGSKLIVSEVKVYNEKPGEALCAVGRLTMANVEI